MVIRPVNLFGDENRPERQQEVPACLAHIIACRLLPGKESSDMVNAETIAAMSIEEIKANFFDLMDTIVTTYGDNQDETADQQQPEGESNAKES